MFAGVSSSSQATFPVPRFINGIADGTVKSDRSAEVLIISDSSPPQEGELSRGHTGTCPAVKILKVTHKGAAHGDAACSPPLLWPLVISC